MVFLMEFIEKSAEKNFLAMYFTSNLKLLAILLAVCNSPVMELPLCLVGIFEDQCTGSFRPMSNDFI